MKNYRIKYTLRGEQFEHMSDFDKIKSNSEKIRQQGGKVDSVELVSEEKIREEAALTNPYKEDKLSIFTRGLGQGVTLGLADEVQQTEEGRREAELRNKLAEQADPIAYGIGDILGGIPTGLGVGKLVQWGSKAGTLASLARQNPTLAGLIGKLIKPESSQFVGDVISGGIEGAGRAEEGQSRVEEALEGALLSGALSKIGEPIQKWLSKPNKTLDDVLLQTGEAVDLKKGASIAPKEKKQIGFGLPEPKRPNPDDIKFDTDEIKMSREKSPVKGFEVDPTPENIDFANKIKELAESTRKFKKSPLPELSSGREAVVSAGKKIIEKDIRMPESENLLSPKEYLRELEKQEEMRLIRELAEIEKRKGGKR